MWPSTPVGFQKLASEYTECVTALGTSVMKAIALALDVDENIFLARIDKAFWNLRILGYEGRKAKITSNAGIGQHTGMHYHFFNTMHFI